MELGTDHRARILVVEDDPHIQLLLRHLLRSSYHLDVAVTFSEALRIADQQAFDLFLIDLNLGPGPTGIDLLEALRAIPTHRTTPAVSCTAYTIGDNEDRERFLSFGFDAYLEKPFRSEQLRALIASSLYGHSAT